jgi:L-asparagine transporter-like permease
MATMPEAPAAIFFFRNKKKYVLIQIERQRKYNIETKYFESCLCFVYLLITISNISYKHKSQHADKEGEFPWVAESKEVFGAA